MREREIEAYFIKRVREAGGLQRKFVSPGHRGVPDRIVVYCGEVSFVELKGSDGLLRADQSREHRRLRMQGARVSVLRSIEDIDYFITWGRGPC
jgi:hypothetical protein